MKSVRAPQLFLLIVCCMAGATAASQEELRDDRKIETRPDTNHSMTEAIYKRLAVVHEKLGSDQLDLALADLEKLKNARLNDYEEALVHQTFGFVYAQKNELSKAIASFENSLAIESLPGAAQQGMLYSLAGLYSAEGEYQKSIDTAREWFRYEPDPVADAYILIASGFTELEKYSEALPYALKGIEKSAEPRENWYMLALAIHFQKEQFAAAVPILRTMLNYWPDRPRYWDMLAGAYLELEDDQKALDTMMLAYAKGALTSETRILALVQMNMLQEIPFTAGRILEAEMGKGVVAQEKKNLDILLQAWLSAREYDRAVGVINRLAPFAKDGRYFLQAAGIYSELGEWQKVAENAVKALDAGIESPVEALMLAGTAHAELGEFDEALNYFRRVRQSGDTSARRNADSWIVFVEEKRLLKRAALASR
jgi:tetratricopeptide (TPR) repeat protein